MFETASGEGREESNRRDRKCLREGNDANLSFVTSYCLARAGALARLHRACRLGSPYHKSQARPRCPQVGGPRKYWPRVSPVGKESSSRPAFFIRWVPLMFPLHIPRQSHYMRAWAMLGKADPVRKPGCRHDESTFPSACSRGSRQFAACARRPAPLSWPVPLGRSSAVICSRRLAVMALSSRGGIHCAPRRENVRRRDGATYRPLLVSETPRRVLYYPFVQGRPTLAKLASHCFFLNTQPTPGITPNKCPTNLKPPHG